MSFFIDTSSLVKIYHKEENSQKVIDLYNSNEAIYWVLKNLVLPPGQNPSGAVPGPGSLL